MSEISPEITLSDHAGITSNTLAHEIATTLHESNLPLIHQVIAVLGPERTKAFLSETLVIEAQNGLMTRKENRRRSPGGVFLFLIRQAVTREEHKRIWLRVRKKPARNDKGVTKNIPKPVAKPAVSISWDQVKDLVQQAFAAIGEAKTVKITLIGRPSRVVTQPSCVVLAMKGKAPPTFPKGLPTPPADSTITWAVFVATKQWEKVKDTLNANEADQLILEGYPLVDPKSKANVVLVTSCKSVMQDRAQREAKKSNV